MKDRIANSTKVGSSNNLMKMLDKYRVQYLAFDNHSDRALIQIFRTRSEWKIDFEDQEAVLFVRADTSQYAA
ncbi:MAG: hypothetical protein KKD28_05290 [Chloroflexi bacterium]|nr:hypothetical protein [Chloroflexota bacterium]